LPSKHIFTVARTVDDFNQQRGPYGPILLSSAAARKKIDAAVWSRGFPVCLSDQAHEEDGQVVIDGQGHMLLKDELNQN
jgi:hypothetical protein